MNDSIETIFKHLEHLKDRGQTTMYLPDVYNLFKCLKQCEDSDKKIVGIGYKRFDGVEFKDTALSEMLEGGFAVIDKNK